MQQIGIDAEGCLAAFILWDGDLILFGIADQLGARPQIPFTPRRDHFNVWLQRIISQFKPNLIIAFAGGAMRHSLGTNRLGDFDLPLGN